MPLEPALMLPKGVPQVGETSRLQALDSMKLAGFLLLIAGWGIAVLSICLLPASGARSGFVLTAVALELFGLALAIRSHLVLEAERE
jgi:hypothetical protein